MGIFERNNHSLENTPEAEQPGSHELSHAEHRLVDSSFPLVYAYGNILFGEREGERSALYKWDMNTYQFLPDEEKTARLWQFADMAYSLGTNFSLYRVNRYTPEGRYAEQAEAIFDPEHGDREAWDRFVQSRAAYLEQRDVYTPELYLSVSIGKAAQSGKFFEDMTKGFKGVGRKVEELFGVAGPRSFTRGELDRLEDAEETVLGKLGGNDNAAIRRARTDELQWLIRRAQTRGVQEPYHDPYWRPEGLILREVGEAQKFSSATYHPLQTDFIKFANAPIYEDRRSLVVQPEECEETHQAMLALGSFPEEDRYFPDPVLELMSAQLNRLPFPVDATLHVQHIPNNAARALVRKRIRDADNIFKDQADSTQGTTIRAHANRSTSREVLEYLDSAGHPPLLYASLFFAVGAKSAKELNDRVERLKNAYQPAELHRPFGLQAKLYRDQFPLAGPQQVHDYRDVLTIADFGALMPNADEEVGSLRGNYIGYTTSGSMRHVYSDPTEASEQSRPPAMLLAGTLGSGKTIAAQLFAINAVMRGSRVIDIDPKPDHKLHLVPELEDKVDVIELSDNEQYRGILDPLRFAAESVKVELATSYLLEILPATRPEWQTEIRRAVMETVANGENNLTSAIENLEASHKTEARSAAEAIRVWLDSGLGRLALGSTADTGIDINKPVTTIRANDLTLPSPDTDRANYTQDERLSSATMKLLAAFALKEASNSNQNTVVSFDEAWMLMRSADGQRLLDRLLRLGRSQNVLPILATQTLGEMALLEPLIGTKVIFGLESVTEAERALQLLNLDPKDKKMVARLRGNRRGRGFMSDLYGRVTEIQIDPVDPELLRILDTTPKRKFAKSPTN